jgi:hypothetical protein
MGSNARAQALAPSNPNLNPNPNPNLNPKPNPNLNPNPNRSPSLPTPSLPPLPTTGHAERLPPDSFAKLFQAMAIEPAKPDRPAKPVRSSVPLAQGHKSDTSRAPTEASTTLASTTLASTTSSTWPKPISPPTTPLAIPSLGAPQDLALLQMQMYLLSQSRSFSETEEDEKVIPFVAAHDNDDVG